MKIIKIPRTDEDVDNSAYEIKTSYEVTDDYGKTETFYKKEVVEAVKYEEKIDEEIASLQEQLSELQEKKRIINELK